MFLNVLSPSCLTSLTPVNNWNMSCVTVAGYSTSVGEKNNILLYFAGAPRFEHTGQVVVFRRDGEKWIADQRINADQVIFTGFCLSFHSYISYNQHPFCNINHKTVTFQIGSYFGAELCSVDIDSDGNTDFLLVGAPLFYQSQEKTEGQIHVYRLTEEVGVHPVLEPY